MKYLQLAICCIGFISIFVSCKKETTLSLTNGDCNKFKKAVIDNDGQHILAAANASSIIYSRENIEKLIAAISNDCDITVTSFCFNCIDTNPPMSEIVVSFSSGGLSIQKTIDLSYSSTDNILKVMNVHE